jgi:hypothetical protein
MDGHTIFDQLEAEWADDASTYLLPPHWQADAPLVGWTPSQLVTRARNRRGSNSALAALVRRAHDDELAALTAALILLPAVAGLLGRIPGLPGDDTEDRAMIAFLALWEVIRNYPCHRQGTVAGNVSADVLQRLVAERYGPIRTRSSRAADPSRRMRRRPVSISATVDLDALDETDLVATPATSAGAELLALLGQAVADGSLNPDAAALIGRSRICDTSAAELAGELGVQAQSVRRQRQRFEQQLIAAAA